MAEQDIESIAAGNLAEKRRMKTSRKIGIIIALAFLLVSVAAVGLFFLNVRWIERDVKKFRTGRGLPASDPAVEFQDYITVLKRKYPFGTPRDVVRKEFNDCDKVDSIPIPVPAREKLGSTFQEVYTYKLGLWGRLEIHAFYDSLSRITDFSYFFQSHKYAS